MCLSVFLCAPVCRSVPNRPSEMRLRERPYGPKGDVQAYIQTLMEIRAGLYPFVQWVDQAGNVYEDGSDAAALEGMMRMFGAPSNGLFWPQGASTAPSIPSVTPPTC